MDLNTITEVRRPASADAVTKWENGFAWLAGGTWLFSEPQINTHTLIDLETLKWPSLQASKDGLEIAATCRLSNSISSWKKRHPIGRRRLFSACVVALSLHLSKSGMKPP
jgi:CO/xanthine dehydrogenase FAD-binding subunit